MVAKRRNREKRLAALGKVSAEIAMVSVERIPVAARYDQYKVRANGARFPLGILSKRDADAVMGWVADYGAQIVFDAIRYARTGKK
jgi:hypothetical protein